MKKLVRVRTTKDMGVIHTHREAPFRSMIALSSSSFPLKPLHKVDKSHLRTETWGLSMVKKWEVVLKCGAGVVDLRSLLWVQLLTILEFILTISMLLIISNIISSIITLDMVCSTKAIRDILHMEDTMDTMPVTAAMQDVSPSSARSACFLQWQLIKIACRIDNATFDQRWWRSSQLRKRTYLRDTPRELRS